MCQHVTGPKVPGDVAVIYSGGSCPGGQRLIEAIVDRCAVIQSFSGRSFRVLGSRGGFDRLLFGDRSDLVPLSPENVRRHDCWSAPVISFGKKGPRPDVAQCRGLVETLLRAGIRYLILWGGNYSIWQTQYLDRAAEEIAKECGEANRLRIGCLPKSVDNDLGLASHECTIGFSTASRRLSDDLLAFGSDASMSENYMHLPVFQGNQVGHLTERAARLSGCPLYLIPEHFGKPVSLDFVTDIILGALLKGMTSSPTRNHLVAPIAEGIIGVLESEGCPGLAEARQIEAEGVTANRFPLASLLQESLATKVKSLVLPNGRSVRLRSDYHGYVARGADVDHIDAELCETLGVACVDHLLAGNTSFLVSGTALNPIIRTLAEIFGDEGKLVERRVDVMSPGVMQHWLKGRDYRLLPSDLADGHLSQMAKLVGVSTEAFTKRFSPVADWGNQYAS